MKETDLCADKHSIKWIHIHSVAAYVNVYDISGNIGEDDFKRPPHEVYYSWDNNTAWWTEAEGISVLP